MRSVKMTPLKSSRELLSVRQESVEPQPRGVPKKEPDLGPQEQRNCKEKLRPFQRSGEEMCMGRQSAAVSREAGLGIVGEGLQG